MLALAPRFQVVSDMPPHRSLRGAEAVGGGRTFDDGCRGVGGNWAIPTCSVGAVPLPHLRSALAALLLDGFLDMAYQWQSPT